MGLAALWRAWLRSEGPGCALELGDDGSTYLARVDLLTTEGIVVGTHDGNM